MRTYRSSEPGDGPGEGEARRERDQRFIDRRERDQRFIDRRERDQRFIDPVGRTRALFRALEPEQRLAGLATIGLVASMFTSWWRDPLFSISYSGFNRLTFLELALLLISVSVLVLLVRRAEGRVVRLPLSDGTLAAGGGIWASFLVIFRMLDPPTRTIGEATFDYDLRWGIFLALALTLLLALAGARGRRRHHRGEPESVAADADATPTMPLRAHTAERARYQR